VLGKCVSCCWPHDKLQHSHPPGPQVSGHTGMLAEWAEGCDTAVAGQAGRKHDV
jgi:hypothetical protein